jgi:hypothetical protein
MREGAFPEDSLFCGSGNTPIDDPPDFGAAGAAVGSGIQFLADRLDAATAATHGSDDLIDADAEAGTDGCARILLARAGAPGNNGKTFV